MPVLFSSPVAAPLAVHAGFDPQAFPFDRFGNAGPPDGKDERSRPGVIPLLRPKDASAHCIVIVGGGAGGLELAARLGDGPGRRGEADIVLVDETLTHLWKPLLHEVAAGTRGAPENQIDFLQLGRDHHFRFHLGRLEALERASRRIWLAALTDEEGLEIAPRRALPYDTLVIAIGATDNDFGTPGVSEHALSLNTCEEAERFHRRLLALCARSELGDGRPVRVVIVGGGATGVELAAELSSAGQEIASYGSHLRQSGRPLRISLIEAGPQLLAGLPEPVVRHALALLVRRHIAIRLNRRVVEVRADGVLLEGQEQLPADLTVWAAGVKGPEVLAGLDGLETNRQRQLLVRPTLQSTLDDNIFALGDCASCRPHPAAPPVPPKAQAAQQEARLLARSLERRLVGKAPLHFRYRERGTFLSLGPHRAVGSLEMGAAPDFTVGGLPARLSYWILYRRHLAVLLGILRTVVLTFGQWLSHRSQPRVKLH